MVNQGTLNWNPTSNTTQVVQPGYYSGGTLDSTGAYNKGMEDADARVNEDSESYKEGFIDGLKKERKILINSYSSNKKQTIDMTSFDGWENFKDYNFYIEVTGLQQTTSKPSGSYNQPLIITYDNSTGSLSIPVFFNYFTSGGTYYFFIKYNVYLIK